VEEVRSAIELPAPRPEPAADCCAGFSVRLVAGDDSAPRGSVLPEASVPGAVLVSPAAQENSGPLAEPSRRPFAPLEVLISG
jgi:hypothetical protein